MSGGSDRFAGPSSRRPEAFEGLGLAISAFAAWSVRRYGPRRMKAAAERFGARIVAYAVLANHIHLVMEAQDRTSLSRALIGLNTRIGKGINQITGTRGRVIEYRPHLHLLKTPVEVKNALRYVAENSRRHAEKLGIRLKELVDRFTSLGAIDLSTIPWLAARALGPPLGAAPQSWLLREGWRRARGWLESAPVDA